MRSVWLSIVVGAFCAAALIAPAPVFAQPSDSSSVVKPEIISKELMDKVRRAAELSIASPELLITQHVDYFPMGLGVQAVLPMTTLIEWTGTNRGPTRLSVFESVEDLNLSTSPIERELEVKWDGHSLSWERNADLNPGQYLWRVAVHDGEGTVIASAEKKIVVDLPQQNPIEASSLIVGKSCEEQGPSVDGLRRRTKDNPSEYEQTHSQNDPLRAVDCRIKPDASDRFVSTDLLHAFVRIYPSEKFAKHGPESWSAKFILRSKNNPVETEREIPFRVDSASGYLAYVEIAMDTPGMNPGNYTLDVVMHGPGIREELDRSRSISIQPRAVQEKNTTETVRKAMN
jgi:hypothetical protein